MPSHIFAFARFALLIGSALVALTLENATAAPKLAQLIASPEPGWPQFRGPRRDGVSDERGLLAVWPEGGPKLLWSVENVGRGYSSPIIVNDRIFITGDADGEMRLMAFDLNGRPIWQATNGGAWKDPYPGARATPTASGEFLYVMNAHGRLACFGAANGQETWSVDVLAKFGGKNITWGISENVLVDERAVYVTAGGSEALVVALDKRSGEVLWKSAPLHDAAGDGSVENASYVSPILVRFGERRLLLGCSLRHLYCVDADSGALQWTRRFPTTYAVISTMPVLIGDGIFMTAPHGKGGRFFHLQSAATIGAKDGWNTELDTLQGCIVQVGGKLIGSYYGGRKGWAAVEARTGAELYGSSDFVKGAPLVANERIYALCEDGTMALLEAGENQFHVHGRFRFAEAKRDAWAHPVIHGGRLYLRYHEKLSAYDVSAPAR